MTELVDYNNHINNLRPLGLPTNFKISLNLNTTRYTNDIVVRLIDSHNNMVAFETVYFSAESNLTFERRIAKIREAAVKMFNQYVTNLGDTDILKSIEDRLNANREMLVLESHPGPAVDDDDGEWYAEDDGKGRVRLHWNPAR